MIFSPANAEDILRYYKGTYVKFKEMGDDLFYITSVDGQRVTGKAEKDPEGFTIWLDEATPYEADYILPHKSFFQYGQHAVQLQRIPAKQYYRGLCASNCGFYYAANTTTMGIKSLDIGFPILAAFVKKQEFKTLKAAVAMQDLHSVVLNSRMMYHRMTKQICIDFTPIARVNMQKLAIYLMKPIFKDELMEMLRHGGDDKVFQVLNMPEKAKPVASPVEVVEAPD
jgi:hypothetical protein